MTAGWASDGYFWECRWQECGLNMRSMGGKLRQTRRRNLWEAVVVVIIIVIVGSITVAIANLVAGI